MCSLLYRALKAALVPISYLQDNEQAQQIEARHPPVTWANSMLGISISGLKH
jgi:hypothetical protein